MKGYGNFFHMDPNMNTSVDFACKKMQVQNLWLSKVTIPPMQNQLQFDWIFPCFVSSGAPTIKPNCLWFQNGSDHDPLPLLNFRTTGKAPSCSYKKSSQEWPSDWGKQQNKMDSKCVPSSISCCCACFSCIFWRSFSFDERYWEIRVCQAGRTVSAW